MVLCAYRNMCSFFADSAGVKSEVISHPRLIFGRVLIGWASIYNLKTFIFSLIDLLLLPISIFRQYWDLRRARPDIVHLNSSILYSTAVAARLAGLPVVWHVREVLLGGRYNLRRIFAGWLIRRLAHKVICISPAEAQSLGPDGRRNVEVVYNFIDFSKFCYEGIDIASEKKKLGIREDQKVVLSLGGVSFRKGTFEIVESCRYLPDDFVFLVAGPPLKEAKRRIIADVILGIVLRIEDCCLKLRIKKIYSWAYNHRICTSLKYMKKNNLRFIGVHENVVPLLAISDALVFAGMTPHFPRPVYEAWAMKKPVLVFDMNGVRQNIDDGEDGIILRKASGELMADALKGLLSEPGRGKKMGELGYIKSVGRFEATKNIGRIEEIYDSLLDCKSN